MPISTVAQVKTRFRALLDDPAGAIFTDAIFAEAFDEGREALNAALLRNQIPVIERVVTCVVAPGTTSLTPATAGISDFGELVELEERRYGSTDRFAHVWERDKLSQRDATDAMGEFVWRLDALQFIGATESRELRITYWDTGIVPDSTGGSTGIDGATTFLAKYAAGVAGPRKGYEYAEKYYVQAVGQRYPERIGGELYALIEPMVRSRQRVQIAPKPYSTVRRIFRRPSSVYVAPGVGVGGSGPVPIQFSTYAGTITGAIDGVNATFYLPYSVSRAEAYLNGVKLTSGQGYTHGTNVVTFVAPYVPQPGSDIVVEGWL